MSSPSKVETFLRAYFMEIGMVGVATAIPLISCKISSISLGSTAGRFGFVTLAFAFPAGW